uniref:non-specific serine/threonine protein kinase n=1 Tax=Kalanchoe fedtschenkoi TaxID=63787 RepID=A0A7N0U6I8_KALFE
MPSRQPTPINTPSSSPQPTPTHFPLTPPIAAGAGLCSALVLCLLLCKKLRWRHAKRASASDSSPPRPRRYSYAALKKATSNFSDAKRVGQGGFGSVYVGSVHKQQVAVKLMDSGSLQGEREFQNELLVAEKLDSAYVLTLLGFASSRKHMALVYEYMCNGSLQDALFVKKDARVRVWECRFRIALDVARGIEYLHGCDPPVVHCDVKPSNVLLDGGMRAKIGDFGLARFKAAEEAAAAAAAAGVEMEDRASVVEETESVTTMTTVGMDDFSLCMDQSPESVLKGLSCLSDEQSPMRSEAVAFPKISEEGSTGGCDEAESGKEVKERVVEGGDGAVKEYVMEWIGAEIKGERPKSGWVGDSSRNEAKGRAEKKKKKKHSDWWVSLDEEKSSKKAKTKRRPAREWWKEEYSQDLAKKQRKKKRRQAEITDDEYVDTWWPRSDGSNKGGKFSRSGSKRSRGSLDWWLDGLSGESWKGGHHSHDSASGEFPRSCAMSSTPSMRGTVCYVAPEYGGIADHVNFSEKCDVYSYGVLLLVIIAGRRPLQVTGSPVSEFKRANLVSWARHLARAGRLLDLVDKSVESINQDQALCCIKVALLCLQKSPARRPSMKEVVGMLTGGLSLPELPYELSPSPPSRLPHKKAR